MSNNTFCICKCGSNVVEMSKSYSCENKECGLVIWKEDKYFARFQLVMTEEIAKELITQEKAFVRGLVSPNKGTSFDAYLPYEKKEDGRWGYGSFIFPTREEQAANQVIGKCSCGSDVIKKSKSYSCENEECGLIIWKDDRYLAKFQVVMTDEIAKELIKGEKVLIKGMISPNKGTSFDAYLVYEKREDGRWGYGNMDFVSNR